MDRMMVQSPSPLLVLQSIMRDVKMPSTWRQAVAYAIRRLLPVASTTPKISTGRLHMCENWQNRLLHLDVLLQHKLLGMLQQELCALRADEKHLLVDTALHWLCFGVLVQPQVVAVIYVHTFAPEWVEIQLALRRRHNDENAVALHEVLNRLRVESTLLQMQHGGKGCVNRLSIVENASSGAVSVLSDLYACQQAGTLQPEQCQWLLKRLYVGKHPSASSIDCDEKGNLQALNTVCQSRRRCAYRETPTVTEDASVVPRSQSRLVCAFMHIVQSRHGLHPDANRDRALSLTPIVNKNKRQKHNHSTEGESATSTQAHHISIFDVTYKLGT